MILNIDFLLNYGNPDSEIAYFSFFIDFMLIWVPFGSNLSGNPPLKFSVLNIFVTVSILKRKNLVSYTYLEQMEPKTA